MMFERLSEEQEEAVLKEVGYTKEQLEADVVTIKEWLAEQHHLPPSRLEEPDNFIRSYLSGCKGSLSKTKRKMDQYYTYRSHSEIYSCRDPAEPAYSAFVKLFNYGMVPKPAGTKNTVRIVLVDLCDMENEKFDFLSFVRMISNFSEIGIRLDTVSVRILIVFNAKGWTIAHLLHLKPIILRDFVQIQTNILPLRFSNIIMINVPPIVVPAIKNLVIPFLSPKIRDRFIVTSNGIEEVFKYIDKSYLPKDYCGGGPTMKEIRDGWRKIELERRDWFMNELSERCDESKRIFQEDLLANPYFGVPGSLKKLVVD